MDHARHRLDVICLWSCSGKLPGAVANAANRSVEVWLKTLEANHTAGLVALGAQLAKLEEQIATNKLTSYSH